MRDWHYKWILAGIGGGFFLLLGFILAYLFRDTTQTANFASIWGLWVSLIGFAVTIYTLIETQKISQEAQQKIENAASRAQQAIEDSQEQIRQAVNTIRREVLHSDHAFLLLLLRGLRDAADGGQWDRALFCAEHSPRLAMRIAGAGGSGRKTLTTCGTGRQSCTRFTRISATTAWGAM